MPDSLRDTEAHRRLDQHDDMFRDLSATIWGVPERHLRGHEERLQEIEQVVRMVRYWGPVIVGLLVLIAAGQWPALVALLGLLF